MNLSKETVRKATEKTGKIFLEKDSKEATFNVSNYKPDETVFLQVDGVKVNTKKGWKEYKLGLFYRKSDMKVRKSTPNRHSLKIKKLVGAITDDYLIELKQLIQFRMQQTGYYWSQRFVLISDGADWIAKLFQSLFPGSDMILDWYHAMANLWKCAHDLFGEGSQMAKEWVAIYEELLWNGEIEIVLQKLLQEVETSVNQTPLRKLYFYYEQRKDRMKYHEYRNKGYPIGSGSIESADSYAIQNRLKQSRMRWTIENANYVAHLRNKYFSGEWNQIWKTAA